MISGVFRADGSRVSLTSSGTFVRLQVRQLRVDAAIVDDVVVVIVIVVIIVVVVVVVGGHRRSRSSSLSISGLEIRGRSSLELDVRREAVDAVAEAGVEVERKTFGDKS
jgi:hypothetical protein